jgi:hypothetical protein
VSYGLSTKRREIVLLTHLAASSAFALIASFASAQERISLAQVFDSVADIHTWCYDEFEPDFPEPIQPPANGYYHFRVNTKGIRLSGFVPESPDPNQHQSRLDLECYIPQAWVDARNPSRFRSRTS